MTTNIDTSLITPAVRNDRITFDQGDLESLAESIRVNGQQTPAIVYPLGDGRYQLIAGERRYRACKLAGLPLKCEVVTAPATTEDRERAAVGTWIENRHRVQLNPIEEAMGLQDKMDRYGWTVDDLVARLGERRQWVQNRLSLLKLSEHIRHMIGRGQLSVDYGRAMSALDPARQQIALNRLMANPAPTLVWFRRECGQLEQQQATGAFDDSLFFAPVATTGEAPAKMALPPTPTDSKAPAKGQTPAEIIRSQIAYWQTAADRWSDLGRQSQAAQCLATIIGLQAALEALESTITPAMLTTPQAAEYLGISYEAFRKAVTRGRINGRMAGNTRMFAPEELDAFRGEYRGRKL